MGEPRIKLGDSWHRNLVKKGVYLTEVWLGDIQQLRGPNFTQFSPPTHLPQVGM